MQLTKDEFFRHRIERVKEAASLYDIMVEAGFEPRYRDRSAQLQCGFSGSHSEGRDNKPSARYYPAGERADHESYYCFYCTPRPLDVIGFIQRQRGLKFTDALRFLERKYSVRYDDVDIAKDISDELMRLSKADRRADPTRILYGCEDLLRRNRTSWTMKVFIGLCYLLDVIHHKHVEDRPGATLKRVRKWKDLAIERQNDA